MYRIWVLVVASLLSGCTLPLAVTVTSYALDTASYLVSGKSVTDHGISLVLDRDCAMLRVLEGKFCRDKPTFEVAQAILAPLPGIDEAGVQVVTGSPVQELRDEARLALATRRRPGRSPRRTGRPGQGRRGLPCQVRRVTVTVGRYMRAGAPLRSASLSPVLAAGYCHEEPT